VDELDEPSPFLKSLWPGIPGTEHARFDDGPLVTWIAHDAGLFRATIKALDDPDITSPEDTTARYDTELILWHDVRDVEVSNEFVGTIAPPASLGVIVWSIVCQYPILRAKGSSDDFHDFVIAVALLASEHH
jgi:hypothetical protein